MNIPEHKTNGIIGDIVYFYDHQQNSNWYCIVKLFNILDMIINALTYPIRNSIRDFRGRDGFEEKSMPYPMIILVLVVGSPIVFPIGFIGLVLLYIGSVGSRLSERFSYHKRYKVRLDILQLKKNLHNLERMNYILYPEWSHNLNGFCRAKTYEIGFKTDQDRTYFITASDLTI